MKDVLGTFVGILMLAILTVTGLSIIAAAIERNDADAMQQSYVAQIEASDFDAATIRDVFTQASADGYTLDMTLYHGGENGTGEDPSTALTAHASSASEIGDTANVHLARIDLTFTYQFGFLDLVVPHTITAWAR